MDLCLLKAVFVCCLFKLLRNSLFFRVICVLDRLVFLKCKFRHNLGCWDVYFSFQNVFFCIDCLHILINVSDFYPLALICWNLDYSIIILFKVSDLEFMEAFSLLCYGFLIVLRDFNLRLDICKRTNWNAAFCTTISSRKHKEFSFSCASLLYRGFHSPFNVSLEIFDRANLSISVLYNIWIFSSCDLIMQVFQKRFHVLLNLFKKTHISFHLLFKSLKVFLLSQRNCSFLLSSVYLLL